MNPEFTQEDILRYIYKETSDKESREIEEFINRDRAAKLFYLETSDTLKSLDKLRQNPEETSIRIIMESVSESNHLETL